MQSRVSDPMPLLISNNEKCSITHAWGGCSIVATVHVTNYCNICHSYAPNNYMNICNPLTIKCFKMVTILCMANATIVSCTIGDYTYRL